MNKRTALITGASSGIGRELAKIHASSGGDLVIVARRKDRLIRLKEVLEKQYHIQVKVIEKDLSELEAPMEIYDEVKKAGIEIEYLINNAGFGGRGLFHERSMESDSQMMQVNIMALTRLTKLFLPDFVKRNSGRILNVSSTAALMPGPLQAVYYASKAYVTSFSNALVEELRNTNITVSTLMPGATETEFAKTSGMNNTPLFSKTIAPETIAKDAYKGMMVGKLNIISGVSFAQRLLLIMTPIVPKKVMLKQIYQMQLEK